MKSVEQYFKMWVSKVNFLMAFDTYAINFVL